MPFGGLLTLGIIGGVGSIAGGVLGSNAASNAASTQANAAEQSAQLQYQAEQNALNFEKQVYGNNQKNLQPYLQTGQAALGDLFAGPGGIQTAQRPDTTGKLNPTGLIQPWATPFQAPTLAQAEQYPGYQFQLQQGDLALNRAAAANGNLFSGGTLKDLMSFNQGLAQSDYLNVYNQALGQYQQNYNIFQQNQANKFNRLASLAGIGQTSAGQLGNLGTTSANQVGNTLLTGAQGIGQATQQGAAATASGYVGSANALSGALGGLANSASLPFLYNALNQGGGAPTASAADLGNLGLI